MPAATDEQGAPASSGVVVHRAGASKQHDTTFCDPPAAVPHHPRYGIAFPTWLLPLWTRFQRAMPDGTADAGEGPSAKELNQLHGANPNLSAMLVAELRLWRKLTDNPGLTNEQRDHKLKRLCVEATHREVGRVEPVSAWLTSTQGGPADPLLGVVLSLPPPPPAGVPEAEYLYAFAAAAAPHAGSRLSQPWLSAHIGRAVANGARVYDSPSSSSYCLSSALVQWGSTLYVGVAGRQWDSWGSLLTFFFLLAAERGHPDAAGRDAHRASGPPPKRRRQCRCVGGVPRAARRPCRSDKGAYPTASGRPGRRRRASRRRPHHLTSGASRRPPHRVTGRLLWARRRCGGGHPACIAIPAARGG